MTCLSGPLEWDYIRFAKRWHLTAVHPVIPRDSQSAGLDRHFYGVAIVEAVEIVQVYCQPLDMLSRSPGFYQQSAAAAHDALHVEAALDRGRVIGQVILGISATVHQQRSCQNP